MHNNSSVKFRKFTFFIILSIFITTFLVTSVKSYRQADWYAQARCHVLCQDLKKDEVTACKHKCHEEEFTKPGQCSHGSSSFEKACLKECISDGSCHGIEKCCPNDCGFTCQPPINITITTGVPPLVQGITVNEKADRRSFIIKWDVPDQSAIKNEEGKLNNHSDSIVYVIEERHYIGRKYRSHLMGNWSPISRKPSTGPPVVMQIKPATWYQVRIASISKNGSAGFSQASNPFKSSLAPKPPDTPQNLTFSNAVIKNGTLWGVFSWSAPVSDLPISKYTVYWSKRLASEQTPTSQGSVRVYSKVVPPEKTNLKMKRLELNTRYNMQVRAQVQYGKEKMCSQKAGIIVNPAEYATFVKTTGRSDRVSKGKFHIPVRVAKVVEQNGNLSAKIIWKGSVNVGYVVHWESTCPANHTAENTTMNLLVVKGTQLEIKSLIPKCVYHVHVKKEKARKKKTPSGKISFLADPICSQIPPKKCQKE